MVGTQCWAPTPITNARDVNMHKQQNALNTYKCLDMNRNDSYRTEALEATTSPALWTIYIIVDNAIVNHTIMFSEQDAWDYCEQLVHNGLDYEITTPSANAIKVAA